MQKKEERKTVLLSEIAITEGTLEKIKNYPKRVKCEEKDLNIETSFYVTEDGQIISKATRTIGGGTVNLTEAAHLSAAHKIFLENADKWTDIEVPAEQKVCETPQEKFDRYIQEIKDLRLRMADDNIGLCCLIVDKNAKEIAYLGYMSPMACAMVMTATSIHQVNENDD